MRSPARLSTRVLVVALSVTGAGVGCNAILDNQPGVYDEDAAGRGGDDTGAAAHDRDPASHDDGAGASPIAAEDPDAGDEEATGCTRGSKRCGDLCVSPEDPFFGCAAPSCARCDLAHAIATCRAGACAVGTCAKGFADCNGDPSDGCEADLASVDDCGACGIACPAGDHVVAACTAGRCAGTCAPGWGDCNRRAKDGCERDLLSDEKNCGKCGARCIFGRCELGRCVWP